jgi:hypothetical protein
MGACNDGGKGMELSKKRQIVNMKIFLILFFVLIMATNVSAQVSDVCIVYFTGESCGDDCRLTDSFMDGLINEYTENLVAIKYNIDLSQENKNIFGAYRRTYGIPSEVPLVLFGKGEYISGMYNIFRNVEPRIYNLISANGTNCPLDSGYVPPGEVNLDMLPGDPELYESENGEIPEDGGEDLEGGDEKTNETPPVDLGDFEKVFKGDQLFLFLLIIVVVLTAGFLIILVKKR